MADKLLLSGYFGFGNCGDEIILDVEKEKFNELGYDVSYISKNPAEKFAVSRNLFETIRAIKGADIVVSGGGGILQDKTSLKSLFYYLFVIFTARLFKKKTVCFAQGIGPLTTVIGRKFTKFVLSGVNLITVRDDYSKEMLKECGMNRDANICADVAFLFNKRREIAIPYERFIIFSPGYSINMPSIETLSNITRIIQKKSGLPVIIMPLYPKRDFRVAAEVARNSEFPLFVFKETGECLYAFEKSEFVVGMRYHSVVLSALANKAFVSMSYDPKVSAISKEFGMKFVEDYGKMTEKQFEEIFSYNFSNKDKIERTIRAKVNEMRERAEKNFEIFKERFCS